MARAPPAQSPPRAPPRVALGPHATAPAGPDFLQLRPEHEPERGRRGAAPGRDPAGALEPEPRASASPPGYYLRHPRLARGEAARESGARRLADGSRPGPRPRLAPAPSALSWLRPRAPHSREPGRAHSLPLLRLAAESQAARPQCLARSLAPRSRALRPERTAAPLNHPRIPRWGSREQLTGPRSSSPGCKGTHPCSSGLRGERPSHLPAGRAPRGPVPSGGTGVRRRQPGVWEEAGLCPSPGSPYSGRE